MANQWFKFYGGEYLSDPKILQLGAFERSCWVTLLSLASQAESGEIKFLSEVQLLGLSGINPVDNPNLKPLKIFKGLKMINVRNGNVTILNWDKRQRSESYERVKEFRKRQSNVTETTEEKRREENRKKQEFKNSKKEQERRDLLLKQAEEAKKKFPIKEIK